MAIPASTVAMLEEAITAAVADGTWRVQAVSIDGQTTTLFSLEQAIALLGKLTGASAGAVRTRYAAFNKGV